MSNFRIGQKVVCVDDNFSGGYGDEIAPKKGEIYTIRWLGYDEDSVCRLVEIRNKRRPYVVNGTITVSENAFFTRRFRPVVEKSNDAGMAILKKLLEPTHHSETV